VRRAPGIPCALCFSGVTAKAKLGQTMPREGGVVSRVVMPRFKRGIQYSRGVSDETRTSLEYWITRSSRVMTSEELAV
jgi:hypothetical protein